MGTSLRETSEMSPKSCSAAVAESRRTPVRPAVNGPLIRTDGLGIFVSSYPALGRMNEALITSGIMSPIDVIGTGYELELRIVDERRVAAHSGSTPECRRRIAWVSRCSHDKAVVVGLRVLITRC
jgi:hypothetical protein